MTLSGGFGFQKDPLVDEEDGDLVADRVEHALIFPDKTLIQRLLESGARFVLELSFLDLLVDRLHLVWGKGNEFLAGLRAAKDGIPFGIHGGNVADGYPSRQVKLEETRHQALGRTIFP